MGFNGTSLAEGMRAALRRLSANAAVRALALLALAWVLQAGASAAYAACTAASSEARKVGAAVNCAIMCL